MAASDADARRQVERVLGELERPADPAAEQPLIPDPHPDRTRQFRTTSLSRMKTEWGPEDRIRIEEIHARSDRVMRSRFAQAYDILNRLWLVVRLPLLNPDGSLIPGADGFPQWESHPNGSPVEDWSLLTDRDREQFLFEITTHLFEWEQEAGRMWSESMYGKAGWEGAFAAGYLGPTGRLTVDDRTQRGHQDSLEDRYLGIYLAALSRRAEALVRSLARVAQTLKDTMR